MSTNLLPFASIAPSKSDNAYIFALTSTIQNGLACITSASEILLVDRQNFVPGQIIRFDGAPSGVNSLVKGDLHGQSLVCSGSDGTVATFDVRVQKRISSFQIDRAVTAIACDDSRIAVGTEFKSQQAIVSLWDRRNNKQMWQNAENNDEITALDFHPTQNNTILSGGDDGLVSIFDTTVAEEEDSLVQVINHGPIHRAGFLGRDRVYALSSDQSFAVHPVSTPGDEEDPKPTIIGDLRPLIPCQYVIDVVKSGEDYVIAAGTNIDQSCVDLIKLTNATNVGAEPSLDSSSRVKIEPAHGEEIVRAIFVDDESGTVFTAGEDGHIRASRSFNGELGKSSKPSSKTKRGSDVRFKPY